MDKKTTLSAILFKAAKNQKDNGEISALEYQEILTLLYHRISDLEDDCTKSNHIVKVFKNPNFKINIKETIDITLAMN